MDYLSLINCIRANFNMSHLMLIHSINDDQLHAERFSAEMSASFTFYSWTKNSSRWFWFHIFRVICDVWSVIKMREEEEKLLQFLVFNVISTALLKVFLPLARLLKDAKVFEQLFSSMISFKIALITFQRTIKNIGTFSFSQS